MAADDIVVTLRARALECGKFRISGVLTTAADEITRLRAYVSRDCRCPSCTGHRICLIGCSFSYEGPTHDSERMRAARFAYYGR